MSPIEIGQTAPVLDYTLVDAFGERYKLEDALEHGPLLLVIYKSSCQASKTLFPMIERLHQRYADQGLTVYGIAQDSANITRSFARRAGSTFPILLDLEGYAVSAAFDIFATPTVFLIRPDRTVAYTTMGFLKDHVNDLAAAVAAELDVPPQTITSAEETGVPMFVPG